MPIVLLNVSTSTASTKGITYFRCNRDSAAKEGSPPSPFTLIPSPFTILSHTGDSLRNSDPTNSTATGTIVHQKLTRHASDFDESGTTSVAASAAPYTAAIRMPTAAAVTSPMPRNSWKIPVPRPRMSGGRHSARYMGITTAM